MICACDIEPLSYMHEGYDMLRMTTGSHNFLRRDVVREEEEDDDDDDDDDDEDEPEARDCIVQEHQMKKEVFVWLFLRPTFVA